MAAVSASPKRILVLPFVNRTGRCVHESRIRAFDQSLGAFAAAFLDLEPVNPETAVGLAATLGIGAPETWGSAGHIEPEALASMAQQSGAGLVVLGEIGPDFGVFLRVHASGPSPLAQAWNGAHVALGDDPEPALYDGPRTMLARLAERLPEKQRPTATQKVPGKLAKRLGSAWGDLESASPDRLRAAERAFAELAMEQPRWPAPWVRLALARALRAALFGPSSTDVALAEGPNPARHLARLLGPTSAAERAYLAFVDLVDHQGLPAYDELSKAVAESDEALPALLLGYHQRAATAPPEGASRFRAGVPLELLLHELGSGDATDAFVEKLLARRANEVWDELRSKPHATEIALAWARARGEWGLEHRARVARADDAALAALEALRGSCVPADDAIKSCAAAVRAFAKSYGVAAEGASRDQSSAKEWSRLRSAIQTGVEEFGEPKDLESSELPNQPVFKTDPPFATSLLLAMRVLATGNEVLQARERKDPLRIARWELVVRPARSVLRASVESILEAAAMPPRIAMMRGQSSEFMPYFFAFEPFEQAFDTARVTKAQMLEATRVPQHTVWNALAASDPWNVDAQDELLRYTSVGEMRSLRGFSLDDIATRAECALPRTPALALRAAAVRRSMNQHEQALRLVDASLGRAPDAELSVFRDRLQADLLDPIGQRLTALRVASAFAPRAWPLRRQLGAVALSSGDLELAESALSAAAGSGGEEYRSSCEALAEVAARRAGLAAQRDRLQRCADESPDKWSRAHFLMRVAVALRDLGQFEAAYQPHTAALTQIGRAGPLMLEFGKTLELAGRYDVAEQHYRGCLDLYKQSPEPPTLALAGLLLRMGKPDEAIKALEPLLRRGSEAVYEALHSAYLRNGDVRGLEKLLAEQENFGSLALEVQLYREDRPDAKARDRALASLVAEYPSRPEAHELQGRVLLEAGRAKQALASFERALEFDRKHAPALLGRARAWLALGELEPVRAFSSARTAAAPDDHVAWLAQAALEERDRGPAAAARSLREARVRLRYDEPGRWRLLAPVLREEARLVLAAKDREGAKALAPAFREQVAYTPYRAESWDVLARLLALSGDGDAAREAARTAAIWNPRRFNSAAPAAPR